MANSTSPVAGLIKWLSSRCDELRLERRRARAHKQDCIAGSEEESSRTRSNHFFALRLSITDAWGCGPRKSLLQVASRLNSTKFNFIHCHHTTPFVPSGVRAVVPCERYRLALSASSARSCDNSKNAGGCSFAGVQHSIAHETFSDLLTRRDDGKWSPLGFRQ
jgi:hypothetical protein